MKKLTKLLSLSIVSMLIVFTTSCTKEGPAGPAGTNGTNGTNGTDGTDGTAGCIQCHDASQELIAKANQWEHSVHATGGNFERNSAECAACHTSQGFLQRMANGTHEADGTVENPNPQNCFTCHKIHETYTAADLAFTYAGPLTLWINDAAVDIGKGNLCANCHQPRIPDPLPVPGGGDVNITSKYWGAHHGPQAAILTGSGAYEVGSGYTNSLHATVVTDGCVTCHMSSAYGVQAGGHTMGMTYDYHGHEKINTAGCVECHTDSDVLATKIEDVQTNINDLLTELGNILIEQAVFDSSYTIITGTMTSNQAGAIMNYNMVREDGSEGVHNYNYSKKLLENSIASFQ